MAKSKYCIWKRHKDLKANIKYWWEIECGYLSLVKSISYKFCPYCGKKIKKVK